MKVTAIRTPKVRAGEYTLNRLLDEALPSLSEASIVVMTSKVVSLCEGRVVPVEGTDRTQLIRQESEQYFFPREEGEKNPYHFTITQRTLIPAAGIDASNGDGHYILWPADPTASANYLRRYLGRRFGLRRVGVIITDSTVGVSRWGTLGIAIGYSGFKPRKNYVGQPDLFGRLMKVTSANIAGGLAAAAVVCIGEGTEQTPLAVIEEASLVEFCPEDPTAAELDSYYLSPLNDVIFKPFYTQVRWHRGGKYGG